MKRTILVALLITCTGPSICSQATKPAEMESKSLGNELNTNVWKRASYAWQDNKISKITRGAFWTGCSALTAGIACALTKNNPLPSLTISQPLLWQGLLACGALGIGICTYGANTLMQYYRHFLLEGVDARERNKPCYRTYAK